MNAKLRRIRCTLAGLFLLAAAGCIPAVSWLPDSKSFVFTTASRKIVVVDVAKRSSRVLVEDTKSNTHWPAVSPNGKQVAIARLKLDETNTGRLQVVVYDLAGKLVHESAVLAWGKANKAEAEKDMHSTTQLFWGDQGKKLLIYGSIHATHGTTGTYDLENKEAKSWDRCVPASYGASPIRPDDKGFLLAKINADGEKFGGVDFVDWSGQVRPIQFAADVTGKDDFLEYLWPILRTSQWQGNVAAVTTWQGRSRIDTDQAKATIEPPEAAELMFERRVIWSQVKLESGIQVMVLAESKKGTVEDFSVITWNPTRKLRQVIVEEASDRLVTLTPSPDRKYVVVRVCEGDRRGPDADMIHVIDNFGRAMYTIDVFDRFNKKDE